METLAPGLALVLARPAGTDAGALTRLAQMAAGLGVRPVLFDLSGGTPVAGAVTVSLPARQGLAAQATLLPAAQALVVAAAARRVGAGFGTPLRSSKVTDGEAP